MFEFEETRWDAVKINNSGFISVTPYLLHRSLNQGMEMEGGIFYLGGGKGRGNKLKFIPLGQKNNYFTASPQKNNNNVNY